MGVWGGSGNGRSSKLRTQRKTPAERRGQNFMKSKWLHTKYSGCIDQDRTRSSPDAFGFIQMCASSSKCTHGKRIESSVVVVIHHASFGGGGEQAAIWMHGVRPWTSMHGRIHLGGQINPPHGVGLRHQVNWNPMGAIGAPVWLIDFLPSISDRIVSYQWHRPTYVPYGLALPIHNTKPHSRHHAIRNGADGQADRHIRRLRAILS